MSESKHMTCPTAKWRDLFLVGAQELNGRFTGLRYTLPGYLRTVHAIKVLGYSMTSVGTAVKTETHYVLRCREIHSDVLSNREEVSALCVLPTVFPRLEFFDSAGIASVEIRPPQKFPTLTFELLKWDSGKYTPVNPGADEELALHLQILVDET